MILEYKLTGKGVDAQKWDDQKNGYKKQNSIT